MISTPSLFLGKNLSNFFGGFLENLKNQKHILKLTDLYLLQKVFCYEQL